MSRITVEIDDNTLDSLLRITGEKSKSPAVARAVDEFVKRTMAKEFGKMIREGAFDYPDPKEDDGKLSW